MSDATFNILSKNQSVTVSAEHMSGSHDALNTYLHIPVSFTLRAAPDTGFDLLPVNAQLLYQNPDQLLSDTIGPWGTSVFGRESNLGFVLKFKLDERSLHFIERTRQADLTLTLELNLHSLVRSSLEKYGSIQSEQVKINFLIPRSVWVEKLLPKLGYRNLKLIEIPLTHDRLKEAYSDIIAEFSKAEHYFNLQDYSKCVAHCRCTMDKLTGQLKLIKDTTKSATAFKWLQSINQETLNWIDQIHKASQIITSKAHHTGKNLEFERYEAESIYLVILGLLNYIGHLAP